MDHQPGSLPLHAALLTLSFGFASACTSFSSTRPAPLDVPGPAGQARIFLPALLSKGNDYGVSFARDQREVYFTRRTVDRETGSISQQVLISRRTDGGWSPPEYHRQAGQWRTIGPFVTPDGMRLITSSMRPKEPGGTVPGDFDIFIQERAGPGWGEPRRLAPPVNSKSGEIYASASRRGTLYFTRSSTASAGGGSTLLLMEARPSQDGYEEPRAVPGIPTGSSGPFIAPDESYLLFAAERSSAPGDWDLYVSTREEEAWSTPRRLGPSVNTDAMEILPSVSPDGRYLFFGRAFRPAEASLADERLDVYVIEASAVGL